MEIICITFTYQQIYDYKTPPPKKSSRIFLRALAFGCKIRILGHEHVFPDENGARCSAQARMAGAMFPLLMYSRDQT